MEDWCSIGNNEGLRCPSRDDFWTGRDICDWFASDVERLRTVAGFPGSIGARSAACSTAEGGGINNLLLLFAGDLNLLDVACRRQSALLAY